MPSFVQHPIDLRTVRDALDTAVRRVIGIGIAVGSLYAAACSKPVPPQRPTEVTVAPVVGRQVTDWDEFTGHFESVDAVEIRFSAQTVARHRPAIVDLSAVEYMASLAMGMIVRAARSLRRQHQAGMVLVNPQEQVERALRNAQIDGITPIARDREEALRLLGL